MSRSSAVAIIEAPDCFVVEHRPDLQGELAYAGMLQLFGGHAKPTDQNPAATIVRELGEEIGLHLSEPPPLVWSRDIRSENARGKPVRGLVSLFYVTIASASSLTMKVPGEIVEIPKTIVDLESHQDRLTSFAFNALKAVLMVRTFGGAL